MSVRGKARLGGVSVRAHGASRASATALGSCLASAGLLALSLAGCSHGPKPTAAAPAPATVRDTAVFAGPVMGPTAEDSLAARRPQTRPKSNGSASRTPPAPEPAPAAKSGGSSSAPAADTTALLEPALSAEERLKLEEKTRTTIAEAKTKLESVDAARLDAERLRKYRLANDYLSEAVRARDGKDLQRASTLAHKAKLLAEEI